MNISLVVPANAGTHNPRRLWFEKGLYHNALKRHLAVWVPAFAGTTWSDDGYCKISNKPAAPMPPPTHMVTTASLALRRRPSIKA